MPKLAYPNQAAELVRLLQEDQKEWKAFSKIHYWEGSDEVSREADKAKLNAKVTERVTRALAILHEIGEPTLANIGADGAQALSILALHASTEALQEVLAAFEKCYAEDKDNTYYQAIPSMTDWMLIAERKPQRFGTQWMFDENKKPYLPVVEDFDPKDESSVARLCQRRAEYGVEPFRWPKSLAIPESEQPWLKRPLTELVMRELTDEEYEQRSR